MDVIPDEIADQIDPAIAVDRALTSPQRTTLLSRLATTRMEGAEPADWIAEAGGADAYLGIVEPWMDTRGDKCTDVLAARHALPVAFALRLYVCALYACIATGDADVDNPGKVYELAERAGLWARGYADNIRPARPQRVLTVTWANDDHADVVLDGEVVVSTNFDDHGSQMKEIIETAGFVAGRLGARVEVVGTPRW